MQVVYAAKHAGAGVRPPMQWKLRPAALAVRRLFALSLWSTGVLIASAVAAEERVLGEVTVSDGLEQRPYLSGNMDLERTSDDVQAYTIIDREAITRSSATTVEELLKEVLPMSTSVSNETASGWTGTSSQINLRGLGTSQTLVLVNGRRGAGIGNRGTAEASDQQNINNIPLAAIERIEVLPSSASAIYGSGAIGGVINVVLRRDYVGTEVNVRYGDTFEFDGAAKSVDLVKGFALEEGRTQILLTANVKAQDPIQAKNRDFAEKARAKILKNNPDSVYGMNGSTAIAPIYGNLVNIRSVNGSPLFPAVGSASYTHIPLGYRGVALDGVQPLIANLGTYALGPNPGIGSFSGESNYVGKNESKSVGLSINRHVSDQLNVYMDLAYDKSETESAGNYHGFGVATLAANAPNNPFKQAVYVAFPVLYGDGISQEQRLASTETKRAAVGFTYSLTPDWLINADYAWSNAHLDVSYQRRPNAGTTAYNNAIRNGTLDILRDTTSFTTDISPYWAKAPNFTDQTVYDATLRSAGTLASWYAGDIRLAAGVEYRKWESYGRSETQVINNPDTPVTHREQLGWSYYSEFTVPFISPQMRLPWAHLLDVQVAGRHESFEVTSTGAEFSKTTPTVGLRFAPDDQLMLRASYGEGFVTPTVSQMAEPTSTIATGTVQDPRTGRTVTGYEAISGGNPDLEPETSKNVNVGLVLTPRFVPNLRLSLDYFDIRKKNNITQLGAQTVLDNPGIYGDRVTRDADGNILSIHSGYVNALSLETSGIDTHLSYLLDTALGDFSFNLGYTYVDKYVQQEALDSAPVDYVGIPSAITDGPIKHRANASLYWRLNKTWSFGWATQYYGSYKLNPSSTEIIASQGSDKIRSQMYHDLMVRAALPSLFSTARGSSTELTFGIKNVFNEYVLDLSASNYYSAYVDPRLRQFYLNLKASF